MSKITLHSWSGRSFSYKAGDVVHQVENPTAEQMKLLKSLYPGSLQLDSDDDHNIHRVWHDFCNRFMAAPTWGTFNIKGHELLTGVQEWAKQYPNDVRIVRVDDAAHCGSDLIFISHKCRYQFMGTSVVFIPQCTGEQATTFFLYPSHIDDLMLALRWCQREEAMDRSGSPLEARNKELEAQLLATVAQEER